MSEHTPGPWIVAPGNGGGFVVLAGEPKMGIHATTHTEEDARLIAAAPDLLAALEEIAQDNGRVSGIEAFTDAAEGFAWEARARAAIAKATGEKEKGAPAPSVRKGAQD